MDIIAKWRKRLPLDKIMSGSKQGRSVKPLKDKLDRISELPEQADDYNRLKIYYKKCICAQQIRADSIARLTEQEVTTTLTELDGMVLEYPHDVQEGLVEHRVKVLLDHKDPKTLLKVVKPWPDIEDAIFDVFAPSLGLMIWTYEKRAERFRRDFWSRFMAPLLKLSEDRKDSLVSACAAVLAAFPDDPEEILKITLDQAKLATENRMCASVLIALANKSLRLPSLDKDLDNVRKRVGKTDKSITTTVGNAISNNKWLENVMDLMVRSRPIVMEYGKSVQDVRDKIAAQGIAADGEGLEILQQACSDYGRVVTSRAAPLFEEYGLELIKAVVSLWQGIKGSLDRKEVDLTPFLLEKLEKFASAAQNTFSLDDKVSQMQEDIGKLAQTQNLAERVTGLIEALDAFCWDFEHDEYFEQLEAISDKCGLCKGFDKSEGAMDKIQEKIWKFVGWMAMVLTEDDIDKINCAMNAWDCLLSLFGKHECQEIFEFCQDLHFLSKTQLEMSNLDGEEDDSQPLDEKQVMEQMAELEKAVNQAKVGREKFDNLAETEDIEKLKNLWDGRMDTAETGLQEYKIRLVEAARSALQEAVAHGISLAHGDKPLTWFVTLKVKAPKTWDEFTPFAKEQFKHVDTKALGEAIIDIDAKVRHYEDMKTLKGDWDEDMYQTAVENKKLFVMIMVTTLLLWHTTAEPDQAKQRKKFQKELLAFRAHKLADKDVLPPALYERAWKVLKNPDP